MMGTASEYTWKIKVPFPNVFTLRVSNTFKRGINLSEVGVGHSWGRLSPNLLAIVTICKYSETGASTVKTF